MTDPIAVDPDVLAEIKSEHGPLPDVVKQYDEAILAGLSFDFSVEVPRGDAE